jgi:hypothetical protein
MADVQALMQQTLKGGFADRVRYAAIKAAIAVMNEAAPAADRLAYAEAVLRGEADIGQLAVGVLTNPTIASLAEASSDADVEFTVNAIFDAFAKAGVKAAA